MSRKTALKIVFSDAENIKLREEIRDFYLSERDEEIGIIQQQEILDFFTERLAPVIFNKALDDARRWYHQQQENLGSDYYSLYMDE